MKHWRQKQKVLANQNNFITKISLYSNKENGYQHLIVLFRNREVRGVKKKNEMGSHLLGKQ